jgi:predicted RNA binding protein YcfA (HicA-like mRNA interferase family)
MIAQLRRDAATNSKQELTTKTRIPAIEPNLSKGAVKVRDLMKQLEEHGWKLDRVKGSHRQYRHPERPELRTITVAGHLSEDVPKGTLVAILKHAGLKR